MIVVTGLPRSGTSLMMRILESLSIPITGQQFFDHTDSDRKERYHYLNPDGFFEIRGTVGSGKITNPSEFIGKAVKVVIPGVMRVPLENIEKIIFCLRNPSEVIESQRNLMSNVEVGTTEGKKYLPELTQRSFINYIRSMGILVLGATDEFWNKTLVVEYQELITKPEKVIQKISEFLNVPFVDKNLIKPDLYRSKAVIEVDPLAMEIYNAIKTKNFSGIKNDLQDYLQNLAFENVRWVDESEFQTFILMGLSLYKSLVSNNKGTRDKLVESSKRTKHYFDCPYYSRNGEEYTIRRPGELLDLTRKKVTCSYFKEEKTLEFCYQHFMSLALQRAMKK